MESQDSKVNKNRTEKESASLRLQADQQTDRAKTTPRMNSIVSPGYETHAKRTKRGLWGVAISVHFVGLASVKSNQISDKNNCGIGNKRQEIQSI